MTRREFLMLAAAATIFPGCGGSGSGAGQPAGPAGPTGSGAGGPQPPSSPLPMRTLGRTGVQVSLVGLGGYHLGNPSSADDGVRIVRTAVDAGITFLDNCWDYHDGESERRMGRALRDGYRDRVFLMSKIDGRTREAAARQLDESLGRLGTDRLDLVQIHEVIRASDPDRVFASGGAIEALVAARQAGKIRFIGFTGHKSPTYHLAMLRAADAHGFAFDAVQMPLNVLDAHYDSFERNVLPALLERGIGALGMKPLADARIVERGFASAEECLGYAMSLPVSTVITGCDSLERVAQAVRVAASYRPPRPEDVEALLARTSSAAQGGADELYKTTEDYDGTTQNAGWLG